MAYKALYRTYRPSTFEEVAGQKHVVTTLQNALKQDKLAHAYLFSGPRGTGKTSVAKLFAKAVNCTSETELICGHCESCLAVQNGTHPDVIEIDAASNNGVDEIRELIEKVKYAPIQGKYKVYIIDEVHMLSLGAFNALLKTLEEPPAHVIFILATTEPHKVIPTIISRCQRFDFSKVKEADIKGKVEEILKQEKIAYEDEALDLICTLADGGVRDALSILEQCVAYAQDCVTLTHVNEIYGITTEQERFELLKYIMNREVKSILECVSKISEKGMDIKHLTADLMDMLKDIVVFAYTKEDEILRKTTKEHAAEILNSRQPEQLLKMIDILIETSNEYRNTNNVQSYFELSLLKMSSLNYVEGITQVEHTIPAPKDTTIEVINSPEPVEVKLEMDEEEPEEIIAEELSVEQPSVEEPTSVALDDEFYLGLLVGASKEKRNLLSGKWEEIGGYAKELKHAKTASKLREGKLVAMGEGYILLSVEHQAIANSINLETEAEETHLLTEEMFAEPYNIYAIEKERFIEMVELFKKRSTDNTLPTAIEMKLKKNKPEEDETEQKLMSLFGEGMIDIIEEEETE